MSLATFLIAAALALTLDSAIMPLCTLMGATPSLVGCVASFVALHAERRAAWWGCWALGLLLDLSSPMPVGGAVLLVPGPYALGFTAGAALILQARAEVSRHSYVTSLVATFAMLVMASLVWTSIWTVRGWWPDGDWAWMGGPAAELGRKAWWSLWTALVAVPVSLVLDRTERWWGFVVPWRTR
jgi:rod shape-determining protein MreD